MSEIPAGTTIMEPQTLELVLALQERVILREEIQEAYTPTHLDFLLSKGASETKLGNFEP